MSVPAEVSDVPVYAGDPLVKEYRLRDPDISEGVPGAVQDLSAYTFTCQWRRSASATEYIVLTVDTTDAATGVLVITATGVQTAAMKGPGVFDLQSDSAGTFLRGKTTWTPDVTRA